MIRRRTTLLLLATALLGAPSCSSIRELDLSGVPNVTLDDPSDASAIGKAIEERGAVVVRLKQGEAIPLSMVIDLAMARVEAGNNVVRMTRDVWLYLSRVEAHISPDGRRWAELGDLEAMGELFEIDGSAVQIGFRATAAEGAAITLDVRARSGKGGAAAPLSAP